MGQKTHPIGFRLGIIKPWNSRWYAPDRNFADLVYEDMMIKRYINRRLDNASVANVFISRAPKKVTVDILTSRPGIVIGRRGAEVDKLREELQLLTSKDIALNIVEVRRPELDAKLVADSIARQLEGRVSFRRAMKKSVAATMKMGAEGIKVQCAGRLGGGEIARSEKYKDGRVPLHTLRADIDYATSTAHTTYGCIGVKVWICRGEILSKGPFALEENKQEIESPEAVPEAQSRRGRKEPPRGRGKRIRGRVRRPPDGRRSSDNYGSRPRRSEKPREGKEKVVRKDRKGSGPGGRRPENPPRARKASDRKPGIDTQKKGGDAKPSAGSDTKDE